MKLLVETTGNFLLINPLNGQEIHYNRPTVVEPSGFITNHIGILNIRVLSNELPDEATDAEFAVWFAECGDKDLAVSSFIAKFQAEGAEVEKTPRKPRKV